MTDEENMYEEVEFNKKYARTAYGVMALRRLIGEVEADHGSEMARPLCEVMDKLQKIQRDMKPRYTGI